MVMKMLKNHTQSSVAAYAWLRCPALLLGGVGLWGIAGDKLAAVSKISASFKLPPVEYCYAIVIGAVLLFGISLLSQKPRNKTNAATANRHDVWRNC